MSSSIRISTFAGSPLDRVNNYRGNDALPPTTAPPLYLILSPTFEFLYRSGTSSEAPTVIFPLSIVQPFLPEDQSDETSANHRTAPISLLGVREGAPHYALPLPPSADIASLTKSADARFRHLRTLASTLSREQSAIAAHARALCEFHLRHLFCGLCGSPTAPDHFGSRRRCRRNVTKSEPIGVTPHSLRETEAKICTGVWFPRTDPVAIMLVVHPRGDRVLLGRQKRFPAGLYSCLAGFMEHGEGVEDSVRREVEEESGVEVGVVRFFGSQPWPFPYSLMLGCVAQAVTDHITVDEKEIQDAKWFTREQVREMVGRGERREAGLSVPPSMAIAGQMIAAFAEGDPITFFEPRQATSGML